MVDLEAAEKLADFCECEQCETIRDLVSECRRLEGQQIEICADLMKERDEARADHLRVRDECFAWIATCDEARRQLAVATKALKEIAYPAAPENAERFLAREALAKIGGSDA